MDNVKLVKSITIEIKKYCYENKISFNEFALRCGLTYSTLHNVIAYKNKNIELLTICRICDGMNIDLVTFIKKIAKE